MEIKINVDKQKMRVETNLKTFVSGTQEFIKFIFMFKDPLWKDLKIFAQFRQGDKSYNSYMKEKYKLSNHLLHAGIVQLDNNVIITDPLPDIFVKICKGEGLDLKDVL